MYGHSTTKKYGAWDLEKIQSTYDHRHFFLVSGYGARDFEKMQLDSTLTEFFSGFSITMVHGTYKRLFGIMLLFNEKHVDPI